MSNLADQLDVVRLVSLDWSKLLGFDQVRRSAVRGTPSLKDAAFTKVGTKPCQRAPK